MVKLKKILLIFLISMLCTLSLKLNIVYASAGASLTESKTVYVGDTVVITASVTAGAWSLTLSGNGESEPLNGYTNVKGNASASTSITFTPTSIGTYTFTLSGDFTDYNASEATDVNKSCTITVKEKVEQPGNNNGNNNNGNNGNSGNNNDNEGQTPSAGTNTNNIPQDAPTQTETKSRNYYLSSLSVKTDSGEINLRQVGNESAGFNREVENYVIVFPEDFNYENFDKITISATAEDSKSKISGTGEVTINEGDNNFEIRCTAENGSAKTYKIKVTKPISIKESELKLDSLQINKINQNGESEEVILDKEFNADVLSYNFDVSSDINALLIKLAVSKIKEQDIIVKINANEVSRDLDGNLEDEQIDLDDGINTIRITLISPLDENVSTDYVLTVNKEVIVETVAEVSNDENDLTKENLPKIIIGIIIGIIILLSITLIVLIIINKKQQKKARLFSENNLEDDNQKLFDYDEEDTYLNDKSLEKLNKEYEEKVNKTMHSDRINDVKEKSNDKATTDDVNGKDNDDKGKIDDVNKKNDNQDKFNDTNEENRDDQDKISNVNKKNKNDNKVKENEDNNIDMKYENLSDEDRQKKLDELLTELKSKNKSKNKSKKK